MALRLSRNRIPLKRLQNFCRLLSSKYDHHDITSAHQIDDDDDISPSHQMRRLDIHNGKFRYKVCTGRSSPVERPTISNIIESQCKAQIEMHNLQPSMLPTFQHKNIADSAGIKVQTSEKVNRGPHQPLAGLQVSKTYANVQLPLKQVKLAPPFPEPVKIMNSCKISDDEKAEMMLKEAKSLKLQAPATQAIRRNYSSYTSLRGDGAELRKSSSEPFLSATKLSQTQELLKSVANRKHFSTKNFPLVKGKILKAPQPRPDEQQILFFSQQHQQPIVGPAARPTVLCYPQQMNQVSQVLNDIRTKTTGREKPVWHHRKLSSSTNATPSKPLVFKIKRNDFTESKRKLKTKENKIEKKETPEAPPESRKVLSTFRLNPKQPKVKDDLGGDAKKFLSNFRLGEPPVSKQERLRQQVLLEQQQQAQLQMQRELEALKSKRMRPPYPSYSELCHDEFEDKPPETNQLQALQEKASNPKNYKPKKSAPNNPSGLEKFGKSLAPANSLIGLGVERKTQELLDQPQIDRKNFENDSPRDKSIKAGWNKITDYISNKSHLLLEDQVEHYLGGKKDDNKKEKKLPACKRFPFRPPPVEEEESRCPKPPKKKIIKDCPDSAQGDCVPPGVCNKPANNAPQQNASAATGAEQPLKGPLILNRAVKKYQYMPKEPVKAEKASQCNLNEIEEMEQQQEQIVNIEKFEKRSRKKKDRKFKPKFEDPWGLKGVSKEYAENLLAKKAKHERYEASF